MRIGLNLGYWGTGDNSANLALAGKADELGYAVVWAAEAYGSDAVTMLTWIAARTERIDVGSAVLQIPARTPAMTGMTAATLDTLSGGRFRLGLGVSGPQVSEGWHGVRFTDPVGRTREYVEIVRSVQTRRRVRFSGEHFELPLPGGPGLALGLTFRPERKQVPIYLAAIGPKNLELTGEVADGWLPVFFSPAHAGEQLARIRAGAEAAGRSLDAFDIAPAVPLVVGGDWRECADAVRAHAALYLGGMGSRERNFYNRLAARMGFEAAAAEVQEKYLARDYEGARAAVPLEFLDATSLLGPRERIAERMTEFVRAGVTTLSVTPFGESRGFEAALRTAVDAIELAGVA
ncbi:LLM class F420-dependent oxidoreductase [Amycolatopsis sp. FDAARGOS 1241]|uniref:LLM class F420-dependent oxidoreductase n=1 Tax=Amycolatopsis sp. FDAARGOS 1241 TaxID=2778070 RepID=UPI00194FEC7B|nr:LLM class F420-dependent oxidoreductase [Amycolatopsis sp. FDAARGOS 1241]QRP49902.1 LLM class F420-dependent oxidoreductase [Amycolatopsis sp. FDAARGOS 1241]